MRRILARYSAPLWNNDFLAYYRVEGWRVVPNKALASRRRQVRLKWIKNLIPWK